MRQSNGISYFSNRNFIVSIDSAYSDEASVTFGVLQGSILGPLLFLIYIKDMSYAIDSELLLYADDFSLVIQHKYLKREERLNRDLSILMDWLADWFIT